MLLTIPGAHRDPIGFPNAQVNPQTGKPWTPAQVRQLRKLAKGNTPTGVIGLKLGRTKPAVQSKASEKKISLKPTNRSPYNRRNKK